MTADAGLAAISARFGATATLDSGHPDHGHEHGEPRGPFDRLIEALTGNTRAHDEHQKHLRAKTRAAHPFEPPPMVYSVSAAGLLVPGAGFAGSEHMGPRTGYYWDITRVSVDGLISGTPQQAQGSVTSPGSHVTIAQLGAANIVPGTYTVQWAVDLDGTPAAADANNFQIGFAGGAFTNSENNGAIGHYPQNPFTVNILAGSAAFIIRTAAAGTAGAIYSATMSLTPAGGGDVVKLYKRFGNAPGSKVHTFTADGTTPGPDWEPGKLTCVMRDGDRLQLAAASAVSAAQVVVAWEVAQVEMAWMGDYIL